MREVVVVPHNQHWQSLFEIESQYFVQALKDNIVAIHHIGSTAIPNIYAKPIIDLLIEVKDIYEIDGQNRIIETFGYQAMGEFGIVGRRYFRKDNSSGTRTHHAHVFATNSSEVKRHLAFRDYMIAHPIEAQQYSKLKQKLAQQHPHDIEAYMDGKDEFIKNIDCQAALWQEKFSK